MHALRLLKKRKRLKRGPKEKETFQRYFYCLPNKYAKLPKFSSLDPSEKAVVRQHQEAGFGYPPGDYNDGFPRKTSIYLNYSAEKFHKFIVTMFPIVEDKLYDLYRIDKQRRLIRIDVKRQEQSRTLNIRAPWSIDVKTPRANKDLKYQGTLVVIHFVSIEVKTPRAIKDLNYLGTLVVIPYVSIDVKTPRANKDLKYQGTLVVIHFVSIEVKTPRAIKDLNYLGTLVVIPYVSIEVKTPWEDEADRAPQILFRSGEEFFLHMSSTSPSLDHNLLMSSNSDLIRPLSPENNDMIELSCIKTEPDNTPAENPSLSPSEERCKIFSIAKTLRNRLQPTIVIRVRKSSIISDVLKIYRTNSSITAHKLSVCYTENSPEVDAIKEPCLSMFTLFWSRVLKSNFNGDQEVVPSTDLSIEDDFYFLLGKILYHGIVLCDYWPVKLSQACMATIITNTCSERQLMTSFHHVMTESDRAIIGITKKEFREYGEGVPMVTFRNVCKVLRFYGCKQKPQLFLLDQLLLKVAKFHLVKEPYWQLMQMREGLNATEEDIFQYVNENDIFTFYSLLTPNALTLFNKVIFIHSSDDSSMEMEEKRVKSNFESFIMQLNTENLCNFLFKWCYSDCLCVDQLCVQFDLNTMSGVPIFKPERSTLVLSSMYMSKEELHHLLSTFVSH
ncbi:hypothetical protein KUTeg_007025 [Tegillarca granosa]|uniref:Uncharacterized protein n=1 Tax=Tegillarca granosa TaxID=220873 RepID=A0ABQ9FF37_TEGGR|nr:hypothetical protein KUTeg_007025 [Tegillarca granosa]